MLRWCKDTKGRIKDGIAINCYNWVCVCGSIADKHLLYSKVEADYHLHNRVCGESDCKEFIFHNNDKCTIECQMRYKLNGL